MSNNSNFYSSPRITTIEQAILAEDVVFDKLSNVEGKFYIKVMTPTLDTEELNDRDYGDYQQSNYLPLLIPSHLLLPFMNISIENMSEYVHLVNHEPEKACEDATSQSHILELEEEKYILTTTEYEFIIPKGTIFLVSFIGGELQIDKVCIIGVAGLQYVEE